MMPLGALPEMTLLEGSAAESAVTAATAYSAYSAPAYPALPAARIGTSIFIPLKPPLTIHICRPVHS